MRFPLLCRFTFASAVLSACIPAVRAIEFSAQNLPSTVAEAIAPIDAHAEHELSLNIDPRFILPETPESLKLRKESEAIMAKIESAPAVVEARAAFKLAEKSYRDSLDALRKKTGATLVVDSTFGGVNLMRNGKPIARTPESGPLISTAQEAYKAMTSAQTSMDAAFKMAKAADAPGFARAKEIQAQRIVAVRDAFDFHPEVLAAHKAYTATRADYLKQLGDAIPVQLKLKTHLAKAGGKETTETQRLSLKSRLAGIRLDAAKQEFNDRLVAYRQELLKAAEPFAGLSSWDSTLGELMLKAKPAAEIAKPPAAISAEAARLIAPLFGKASKATSLRNWYREKEAAKSPAIMKLAKARDEAKTTLDKMNQRLNRASLNLHELAAKSDAAVNASANFYQAAVSAREKAEKERDAASDSRNSASNAFEYANRVYTDALSAAVAEKKPSTEADFDAEIAVHSKVSGYPTYTRTKANDEAVALLKKLLADTASK